MEKSVINATSMQLSAITTAESLMRLIAYVYAQIHGKVCSANSANICRKIVNMVAHWTLPNANVQDARTSGEEQADGEGKLATLACLQKPRARARALSSMQKTVSANAKTHGPEIIATSVLCRPWLVLKHMVTNVPMVVFLTQKTPVDARGHVTQLTVGMINGKGDGVRFVRMLCRLVLHGRHQGVRMVHNLISQNANATGAQHPGRASTATNALSLSNLAINMALHLSATANAIAKRDMVGQRVPL